MSRERDLQWHNLKHPGVPYDGDLCRICGHDPALSDEQERAALGQIEWWAVGIEAHIRAGNLLPLYQELADFLHSIAAKEAPTASEHLRAEATRREQEPQSEELRGAVERLQKDADTNAYDPEVNADLRLILDAAERGARRIVSCDPDCESLLPGGGYCLCDDRRANEAMKLRNALARAEQRAGKLASLLSSCTDEHAEDAANDMDRRGLDHHRWWKGVMAARRFLASDSTPAAEEGR